MAATSMAAALAASLPAAPSAPAPSAPTYEAIPASMAKVIDIEAEIPITSVQLDAIVSGLCIAIHSFPEPTSRAPEAHANRRIMPPPGVPGLHAPLPQCFLAMASVPVYIPRRRAGPKILGFPGFSRLLLHPVERYADAPDDALHCCPIGCLENCQART